MELAILVLQVIVVAGISALGVLWRSSVTTYFSEKGKNLATKQDIEEITRKIEGVKVEFAAQQTWNALFQQKRFEVIAKTFELLHDPEEYIRNMVHPVQNGGEDEEQRRQEQAIEAFNQLSGFYYKSKIYLPEDLCERVAVALGAMKEVITKYRLGRKGQGSDKGLGMWGNAYETMRDVLPALRSELEKQFREAIDLHRSN